MKCLVTGASGFIGSHLCERLLSDGHWVTGIDDLSSGRKSNLSGAMKFPNFNFIEQDINAVSMEHMTGCDWVFHLAAKADIVPSIEKPWEYHETNVTGTLRVLEAAKRSNVKRFIYAASSSCYGIAQRYPTRETSQIKPMYPYALTKYLGEEYVLHWARTYKLPAMSLRLFNVYGPRSRTSGAYGAVFGVFLSQLANGQPLTIVGDGSQSRDFTFVSDVVDAFIKAAESKCKGFAMNVGSGGHYTINSLVQMLDPKVIQHIPDRPGEPKITFADTRWIRAITGWAPKVSFEEGVWLMKELAPTYKDAPLWTKETIAKATDSWFKHLGG